jgi:hypothetical protein
MQKKPPKGGFFVLMSANTQIYAGGMGIHTGLMASD